MPLARARRRALRPSTRASRPQQPRTPDDTQPVHRRLPSLHAPLSIPALTTTPTPTPSNSADRATGQQAPPTQCAHLDRRRRNDSAGSSRLHLHHSPGKVRPLLPGDQRFCPAAIGFLRAVPAAANQPCQRRQAIVELWRYPSGTQHDLDLAPYTSPIARTLAQAPALHSTNLGRPEGGACRRRVSR